MEIPDTPRICFRKFEESDLDDVFKLNSDPQVMRYVMQVRSKEEARQDLAHYLQYYDHHPGYGYWAAHEKKSKKFMGLFILKKLEETGECEIGYRLLPEFWGRGLATEGARAWIEYGFKHLNVPRIVAVALGDNHASRRVLEKIGLRFHSFGEYYQCHCAYYILDDPHG